ncbi:MAG TPA: hypothetical protein VM050_01455 [Patescibacteria group bacterium]|nr:hypothetical protein [Patescibacteria group bacterium]
MTPVVVGLIGILISAKLISGSSEYFVHMFDLHVEMGISNLLSGITQSIMLIFPLLALIVPVQLDGYVLYPFLAIAVTLWIVKKSIVDDHKLTLDEGLSILMSPTLGILLFDELSLLI